MARLTENEIRADKLSITREPLGGNTSHPLDWKLIITRIDIDMKLEQSGSASTDDHPKYQ
jgi:hypothetical protein